MKQFLSILFLTFLIFGCKEKTNKEKFLEKINSSIIPELEGEKDKVVILVSDMDCSSCLDRFGDYIGDKNMSYYGFYSSRYPSKFKERLNRINPEINWLKLKDNKILSLAEEIYEQGSGPYYLVVNSEGLLYLKNY